MNFEKPTQNDAESDRQPEDSEIEPRLEQVLTENLEGLQEDLTKVDPEKLSPEDAATLRSKADKILGLVGGLAGMSFGSVVAERSLTGADLPTATLIAGIGLAIGGGLNLLALSMERRREKKEKLQGAQE